MNAEIQGIPETQAVKPIEQLARELAELDPKPVTHFTPDNLEEVMESFLSGQQRNPNNATYSLLDSIDFTVVEADYKEILAEILAHPDIPQKHHRVYEDYVTRSININALMRSAVEYRQAETSEKKRAAQTSFETLNRELYGEPDPVIASAMAHELIDDTVAAADETAQRISREFQILIAGKLPQSEQNTQSLKPSQEARDLVGRIVGVIHRPLLKHAEELIARLVIEQGIQEDKLKISPQAIGVIFQTVIDNEFPESGWKAEIKSANAINVVASKKTIVIPEERALANADKVRGLVVHELGVHMLRSIIGEGADLIPLRYGLAGVGDAEEGIAKVMESVVAKDDVRTGYQHYLTATLLNMGYDFRDTFEIMWRYKVLDAYLDKARTEINEEFIKDQKKAAFKFMFRSIRGTNELPWHITLNYFTGTHKIWDYVERHREDPDLVTILFMGKIDPSKVDDLKAALDAEGRKSDE